MSFQIGQIVQCCRALHPGHQKLIGCVGEIKDYAPILVQLFYNCHYIVYFPNYPSGLCPYCLDHHDPLVFQMHGQELKPIEDPDQGRSDETDEQLPEEIEA